jgi:hypothetical protein
MSWPRKPQWYPVTELIIPLGYFCINWMIWSLVTWVRPAIEYICIPTNVFLP